MNDTPEHVNPDAVTPAPFDQDADKAGDDTEAVNPDHLDIIAADFGALCNALANSSESYSVRSVAAELAERYCYEDEASSDDADTVSENRLIRR